MRIERLKIEKFKSIRELELDFSSIQGLWEISGDVGSGKTSIGEALLFALFGSVYDKNNRDLIMWGEKKAKLELSLNSSGKSIYIKREIKTHGSCPIDVTIDGEPLVFTNKRDAQSILESEYYDVPRLSLELLCIITFNGFKSLSTMSSSDSKKFLDSTFNLSVITDLYEAAQEEKAGKETVMNSNSKEIFALNRQIDLVNKWKDTDTEKLKRDLEDLRNKYEQASEAYSALIKKREEESDSVRRELSELNSKLSVIKSEGARKKKEIDFLSKGVCPTCGQRLDDSMLPEYEAQRKTLLEEYKSISEQIETKNSEADRIKQSYSVLEADAKKASDAIREEGVRLREQLKHAVECSNTADSIETEIERLKVREEELNAEISQWQELCSNLSGEMRSLILNEYTPYINDTISRFMAQLRQPYAVTLDNQFKCTIKISSKNTEVPVSMLSTGQKKVLDMVLILSVLTVIMNKVNFNVCFCDELLSNMDKTMRDNMCILLKENLKPGQSVFLLSHATLNENLLDGRICCTLSDFASSYEIQRQ